LNIAQAIRAAGDDGVIIHEPSGYRYLVSRLSNTRLAAGDLVSDDWRPVPKPIPPVTLPEILTRAELHQSVRRRSWEPQTSIPVSPSMIVLSKVDVMASDWEIAHWA
jgi:hypothetical protein